MEVNLRVWTASPTRVFHGRDKSREGRRKGKRVEVEVVIRGQIGGVST